MATDDDTLLRARPKSTLLGGFARPATTRQPAAEPTSEFEPEPQGWDEFPSLPLPGSPYDAAHSRASNKPLATLRFIMGDTMRGLPYANLDSVDWVTPHKPGSSPAIVIRFTGLVPREATLNGRNLVKLYDLLSNHLVAWVREMPKGREFKDASTTVITSIMIERITELIE